MKHLHIFLLIFLLFGCHRSEVIPNSCGVENPLSDLPWLSSIVQQAPIDLSVTQATYGGRTVYVVSSCGRCFAGPNVTIYQCDGTVLCSGLLLYGNPTPACKTILDSLTDRRILLEKNGQ